MIQVDYSNLNLNGKRILFFSPSFFGYEHEIVSELENFGAEVYYFDERPFTSSLLKVLNRINFKYFMNSNIQNYYANILKLSREVTFDFLFVVSPETMDVSFISSLGETNSKMIKILYMWDSIKNKKHAQKILHLFDRVYTFDESDLLFNSKFNFLPLFYPDSFYSKTSTSLSDFTYAACFIGSAHSDRVRVVRKIVKQFESHGHECYVFLYCPGKLFYWLKKLFSFEYAGISFSDLSFKPLSKEDLIKVIDKSLCVIDIQHPGQTGLTMRTIEMVGYSKKIVTTNPHVTNYDFFNPENILVVDRNLPIVPKRFIDSEFVDIDVEIHKAYSLKSWLTKIFLI